jgi:hypothetical protein
MSKRPVFLLGISLGILATSSCASSVGIEKMYAVMRAIQENDESRATDYISDFKLTMHILFAIGVAGLIVAAGHLVWVALKRRGLAS